MGSLQWVMALLVTGVGALVLVYCAWYFADDEPGLPAFAGNFVAFAGAMLGLVLADDLLLLYVFWELTTVFSYLLIGHDPTKRASRRPALQALIVTTPAAWRCWSASSCSASRPARYRISEIARRPAVRRRRSPSPSLLILVGAISKSALVPVPLLAARARWPRRPRSAPTCTPRRW